jgi:hypothetical protein
MAQFLGYTSERPLCVIEFSVTRSAYMNLNIFDQSALNGITNIKNNCHLFNGMFTLLWHNNSYIEKAELALYNKILNP